MEGGSTHLPDARVSRRIAVLGTSCSGKSTFARALSKRTGIPHVELDALFWGPGWQAVEMEEFRQRVGARLAEPEWISDGNYGKVRDLVLEKVETLLWLDYPFHLIARRALKRTFQRILSKEALWNGNRETIRRAFFSKDSILYWVLKTHRRRRKEYLALAETRPITRLRSPAEAERYLATKAARE